MFGNLIWLLFWSYVGSIKPNLKVPIFPNLEYIFQSPEKIFLWSPLCFFLHFSKRTVEGTIYWQNTDFFTKNQSPDRISPEFGTFKSRKFRSLVITNQLWSSQHSYEMSATKLKLTISLRESYSKTFFGIELFIVVLFYSKLKI
jgi:hypothetical protein